MTTRQSPIPICSFIFSCMNRNAPDTRSPTKFYRTPFPPGTLIQCDQSMTSILTLFSACQQTQQPWLSCGFFCPPSLTKGEMNTDFTTREDGIFLFRRVSPIFHIIFRSSSRGLCSIAATADGIGQTPGAASFPSLPMRISRACPLTVAPC